MKPFFLIFILFTFAKAIYAKNIIFETSGIAKVGQDCFVSVFIKDETDLNIKELHLNIFSTDINEKPKFHPVDPNISSKVIIASLLFDSNLEKTFALTKNLCEAVWVKDLDVSDENIINKICEQLYLKESTKNLYNKDLKIVEVLENNTSDAKKNNVFGVPTFLYKNELFFGQDRMFMLEQTIKNKV